jgi:hypothetical protein
MRLRDAAQAKWIAFYVARGMLRTHGMAAGRSAAASCHFAALHTRRRRPAAALMKAVLVLVQAPVPVPVLTSTATSTTSGTGNSPYSRTTTRTTYR